MLILQDDKMFKFNVSLINGITGSGKTEIYFHIIAKLLQKNSQSQILLLLPEIILTTQIVKRFKEQFNFMPLLWHSSLEKFKRKLTFKAVLNGSARVIIGTRSALFLPFKNLSLIIIDEEHDSSYKQEEQVIYHGRDMAIARAKIEDIPVVLSSATPSMESLINVEKGKYRIFNIKNRFGKAVLPKIKIIDIKENKPEKGKFISNIAIEDIAGTLKKGKQAMIYLNRRGYCPIVLCFKCGHKVECKNCSSCLTYHQKTDSVICHYCNYRHKIPSKCNQCGKTDSLILCGPGVERIKCEIEEYFPESKIALMTSDFISDIKESKRINSKIINGYYDIIIGTQMIAKGHNFPHLDLVVIVDADITLQGSNPRSFEKTYQILSQISGRAGRKDGESTALIQTVTPNHPIFHAVKTGNMATVIEYDKNMRKISALPPFGNLAMVICSSRKKELALVTLKNLLSNIVRVKNLEIMGPAEMPIFKIGNKYRYRAIIKTDLKYAPRKLLSFALVRTSITADVKIKFDVNPYDL